MQLNISQEKQLHILKPERCQLLQEIPPLHHCYLKQHGTNLRYEWSIAVNLIQCLIKANASLWPICSMDIILIANIGSHPNKSARLQWRCLCLCQLNIYPALPTITVQQNLGTKRTRRLLWTPFFSYNDSLYLSNLKLCVGKIQVLFL